MNAVLAVAVLAIDIAAIWQSLTRDTNTIAANRRGQKEYAAARYPAAAGSFRKAHAIRPTPESAFNLGTAQIAAGQREEGSSTLSAALNDERLRASALYNRGNSALAANAFDHAIRDYIDVLKLRPRDAQAKRNLEIALARKRSMRAAQNRQQQNSPSEPAPQSSQQSAKAEEKGDPTSEALLRAVQQQEQEEMSRMRRARPEPRRVGW